MKYLIGINICVYYMKGLYNLKKRVKTAGSENYIISFSSAKIMEQLKAGFRKKNAAALTNFLTGIKLIPIISCFDTYAREKARLQKSG